VLFESAAHTLSVCLHAETRAVPLVMAAALDRKISGTLVFGDPKPYAFLQTDASENFAHFSPDGRLVAYTSDESGQPEIYVAPFQGTGKWQVSASGGQNPRWRRDGRELYFLALDGSMMAATASAAGDAFKVEEVRRLFQVRASAFTPFAVTPDGQRFLVVVDTTAPPTPTLILNWPAALKTN
jgi:dipeptidyl aminopeptidase/acylaminoacyl peptidase